MRRYSSLIVGVLFILVGILLLLNRLHVLFLSWHKLLPLALLVIGLYFFYQVILGKKENAFLGTVFLVLAGFFALKNYHFIHFFHLYEYWPIFFVALGLGFIVLYVFKPADWALLIPGSILTFMGIVILLHTVNVSFVVIRFVQKFWPLVLVIIGIGLITSALCKRE